MVKTLLKILTAALILSPLTTCRTPYSQPLLKPKTSLQHPINFKLEKKSNPVIIKFNTGKTYTVSKPVYEFIEQNLTKKDRETIKSNPEGLLKILQNSDINQDNNINLQDVFYISVSPEHRRLLKDIVESYDSNRFN